MRRFLRGVCTGFFEAGMSLAPIWVAIILHWFYPSLGLWVLAVGFLLFGSITMDRVVDGGSKRLGFYMMCCVGVGGVLYLLSSGPP